MTREAGFTIIELVIVMAVMVTLIGVGYAGWVQQLANRELQLAATTMNQAMAQAQGQARRGTPASLTVDASGFKVGTRSYPLQNVRVTTVGATTLNFTSPYGTIALNTGQRTPIVYTFTSGRRSSSTLNVSVTSILGKVITK